jgi:hypothetical protein
MREKKSLTVFRPVIIKFVIIFSVPMGIHAIFKIGQKYKMNKTEWPWNEHEATDCMFLNKF